jgi:methylthioribose-1-phosphate isomerase
LVPDTFHVRNPAFDVTPHRYFTGWITEVGVVQPPFGENLAKVAGAAATAG